MLHYAIYMIVSVLKRHHVVTEPSAALCRIKVGQKFLFDEFFSTHLFYY